MKRLLLAGLLTMLFSPLQAQTALVNVTTAHADGRLQVVIEQNTSLEAQQRALLYPQVSGQLSKLLAHKGDRVQAGQTLAELNHAEESASLAVARASLTAARARVAQSSAKAANAQSELDRYSRLAASGFSTQQELSSRRTDFQTARADLKTAEATVVQAKAQVGVQAAHLEKMFIRAPFAGTILNDYDLTVGAMVGTNQPVFELADLAHLKGTLVVPETRRYDIHPGSPVDISVDALSGDVFRGRVAFISDAVDTATRTVAVDIHLDRSGNANRLRPGMFGRARIILKEVSHAFVLPVSALGTPTPGDSAENWIWLVKDGRLHRQAVTTGLRVDDRIQIVEGLSEGDQVVTVGGAGLTDGQDVTIMDATGSRSP